MTGAALWRETLFEETEKKRHMSEVHNILTATKKIVKTVAARERQPSAPEREQPAEGRAIAGDSNEAKKRTLGDIVRKNGLLSPG